MIPFGQAWASEKDLKRNLHALRADKEDLTRRLSENAKVQESNDEMRRDLVQREAMLQASQRQLQDSLTRYQHEASLREDALRTEVADMRRRWQDATQRSEAIAADVHESTAPLLRQVLTPPERASLKPHLEHSTGPKCDFRSVALLCTPVGRSELCRMRAAQELRRGRQRKVPSWTGLPQQRKQLELQTLRVPAPSKKLRPCPARSAPPVLPAHPPTTTGDGASGEIPRGRTT